MSDDMIERVARAILDESKSFGALAHTSDQLEKRLARAAIEAMREPTEAMQRAIPPQDYTMQHYYGTGHHATFPTLGSGPMQVWHAMIDTALGKAP